ncbi:LysR family transcriptional regulator [Burkholderia vietnamiensis]|uniref:LysR family transcriptional regulator n=1 Tax=Burkholderia vietnamiensis TaxID=60552 RepID=UPI001CB2A76A|nr:LysR family transcriptional regulator [Burkholderia vietnamiensis]CAG9223950.1 Transcriptional activator GpuR [Burkholderia vietnamiensis]
MLASLSDLDLKSLRVYCTIVEAGGFTAAQSILNMGLPRLSIVVRDLEVRLGTKLCHRGRQGFQVTDEGMAVYESARVLFSDIGRFLDSVGVLNGQPKTRLEIGFVDGLLSFPGAPIVSALERFKRRSPATHLTVHVMRPDELEKAVLEERLTLAVGAFHHRLSGLVYKPIFSEEQNLYCSFAHPLSSATGVGLMEAIANADYVERGYMVESQRPHPVNLNRAATAYNMEAILTMLLTGLYIGYLPTHFASRWVAEKKLFALAPAACCYSALFSVATRQGKALDPIGQLMLDSFDFGSGA